MSTQASKTLIYVDTNILIATMEGAGFASEAGWRLLQAAQSDRLHALTSELTLAEVLPGPRSRGDAALEGAYLRLLGEGSAVDVVSVTREVLIAAAGLRATHRSLKLADAIHLATALSHDCDLILTEDERLASLNLLERIQLGSEVFSSLVDLP